MDKQKTLNKVWYELKDAIDNAASSEKLGSIILKLRAAIDMGEGLEKEQFSETYKRLFGNQNKSDFNGMILRQKEGAKVFAKEMNELGREISKKTSVCCNKEKRPYFSDILKEMQELYEKKNHDYGNSFSETIQEFGFSPAIARINDKFKRVKRMAKGEQMLVNESMRDNLIDIANYCILTVIELDKCK